MGMNRMTRPTATAIASNISFFPDSGGGSWRSCGRPWNALNSTHDGCYRSAVYRMQSVTAPKPDANPMVPHALGHLAQATCNKARHAGACQCPPGDCSPIAGLLRGDFHRLFEHRRDLTSGLRDLELEQAISASLSHSNRSKAPSESGPGELPVVESRAIERRSRLQNRATDFPDSSARAGRSSARAPQHQIGIERFRTDESQRARRGSPLSPDAAACPHNESRNKLRLHARPCRTGPRAMRPPARRYYLRSRNTAAPGFRTSSGLPAQQSIQRLLRIPGSGVRSIPRPRRCSAPFAIEFYDCRRK